MSGLTKTQWAVLGLLGLSVILVFCCLIWAALALSAPRAPAPAVVQDYVPADTETLPAPTAQQSPTSVPKSPTTAPSRTPTPTATPTPTPAPRFTDAERTYMASAEKAMTPYFSSCDEMGRLLSETADNPLLMVTDDWKLELTVHMAVVKVQGERFRVLQPPPRLAEFHRQTVDATKHMDSAIDLLGAGIDDLDNNKIAAANKEISLATQSLNRALDAASASMGEDLFK